MDIIWPHYDVIVMGRDSVSNHQPDDYSLNRLFRRRSKKTSKLRITRLRAGNSPGTGELPAQMASNAENVSIWWRHHDHNTILTTLIMKIIIMIYDNNCNDSNNDKNDNNNSRNNNNNSNSRNNYKNINNDKTLMIRTAISTATAATTTIKNSNKTQ